ncbi:unnamed protein product, partial [marine sediment metagenome]
EKVVLYLQDFGVQLSEIIGFSDSSFRYHIDNKKKYFEYIGQMLIKEMPGGIKADKAILAYCLKHDNALLVSQDLMREYYKYLPNRGWILDRRVAILIVDDEIYLIPMYDDINSQKPENTKNKKVNRKKSEVSNLDVLQIIEDTDKDLEFDFYD